MSRFSIAFEDLKVFKHYFLHTLVNMLVLIHTIKKISSIYAM